MRAFLVALLVATPSLLLSSHEHGGREMIVLLAIIAATLTFIEYSTNYPSFVEFRDAPPINRMRFVSLLITVFFLSIIVKHGMVPSNLTAMVTGFAGMLGEAMDFPYSPVRLMTLMLPADTTHSSVELVRTASGLAYTIALLTVFLFYIVVRMLGWPSGSGAFNVWVNMPLFDPTAGGDVVQRLQRDATINIVLGALLPFMIPAAVKLASDFINPITLTNPQSLIWTASAWAFLPASMVMRGIALLRVAELIVEKRRRTYANAERAATA